MSDNSEKIQNAFEAWFAEHWAIGEKAIASTREGRGYSGAFKAAYAAWSARQPEIDALQARIAELEASGGVYNLVSHHAQASKAFDWLQSVEFGLSTLADGAYGIAVTTDEGVKFISGSTPIIAVQRAMEQVKP